MVVYLRVEFRPEGFQGHDPDWAYHLRMGDIDCDDAEVIILERVPDLALSLTDEHIEGVPFGIHRKVGDSIKGDESICAEHEPVFRIRPKNGRSVADG